MSRLMKSFLVSVLAVSMMLMGPLSAIANPIDTADPAVTFTETDLTASLAAELNVSLGEVTAVQTIFNDDYEFSALIAGLNSSGGVFLAHYDFGSGEFSDWTSALLNKYPNVANISALGVFNGEYTWFIGGTDTDGKAFLVDACDYCVFGHSSDITTADLQAHSKVTGVTGNYNERYSEIVGVTTASPTGFFEYAHGGALSEITETVMPTATGPVAWAGSFGTTGLGAQYSADYWLAGATGGDVLAYGDGVEGQIYADLPGVADTLAIDAGSDGWMLAGRGTDGYMKLFSDSNAPNVVLTTGAGPTQLDLPQTMTDSVIGEAAYPYYIIGGTGGGSGHLYKYKNFADQFIDFDYLLSGMSGLNSMAASGFGSLQKGSAEQKSEDIHTGIKKDSIDQGQGILRNSSSTVLVGGSGAAKLILLTETPLFDVTPVPSGTASTAECGDGTATVDVPAGAINTDYNLLVEKIASGTPAVPGGLSLLGNSYEFECFDADGLPVTTFDGNVTITIHYDVADLNGMSEDSLVIYYYDAADSTWKAVTPCVVDKVNHTVIINVNHFTQFGILGATATAMPYTGQ